MDAMRPIMFLRVGPFHHIPMGARLEVKAIFLDRTEVSPWNFSTRAPFAMRRTGVFGRRLARRATSLATGTQPIAAHLPVPSSLSSVNLIAASGIRCLVLRLGSFIGLIGLIKTYEG